MLSSLLFVALVAFNGVMSDEVIAQVSCSAGIYAGNRCLLEQVNKTILGMLKVRPDNFTHCEEGTYNLEVLGNDIYLALTGGCSGTFDIVKFDPPPYTGGCGVNVASDGFKIIGGERVPACQYPWVVSVRIKSLSCSGSIIDKNHILTTAECLHTAKRKHIHAYNVFVHTGTIHRESGVVRAVQRIFIHEDYNVTHFQNNIAILRLTESIKFDGCQSPVCIASEYTNFIGYECRIMGWGQVFDSYKLSAPSDWLLWTNETIISDNVCQGDFPYGHPRRSIICSKGDKADFCSGDGGSPMVCLRKNKWYVYGLASAKRWNLCSSAGLLTNVPHYLYWIMQTINRP